MEHIPIVAEEVCRQAQDFLDLEIHGVNGFCDPHQESVFARQLLVELQRQRGVPQDKDLCFPHLQYSLSHSKGFCWALYSPQALGLGFDIEKLRPLAVGALRFFAEDQEKELLPDLESSSDLRLQLWTAKEALFKADMKNEGRRLRHYRVVSWPTVSSPGRARCLLDQQEFEFMSLQQNGWALAVAVRRDLSENS